MSAGRPLILRLTIADPHPGLRYSLQDGDGRPVGAVTAGVRPLSLEVPVRYDNGRWLGEFVRREGPERRFVYIAIGQQAGDAAASFGMRAKIDIHDVPAALIAATPDGGVLEVRVPGSDAKGDPAHASVKPLGPWAAGD